MKKELQIITVCPTDTYFSWQVHLWLESLKNINLSNKATILLFNPVGRPENPIWSKLQELYPEASFHIYQDDGTVSPLLGTYIPILRLYTMRRYCEDFPEIENKAVFYCDSDIIFTDKFDISHLLDDDVIYCSDTNSYINASYFDSKQKDVMPHMLSEYKTIDVLDEAAKMVGVTREICEKNNLHSGGTQYLLKNTNTKFWQDIFDKCIPLLIFLRGINQKYFENGNKGLQVWTVDMWLVLWQLWANNQETKIVPELNFAWSTDPISKLNTHTILHNAGITGTSMNGYPTFFKGMYHNGGNPFSKGEHIYNVLESEESQKYCTGYYANKLNELNKKYLLNY